MGMSQKIFSVVLLASAFGAVQALACDGCTIDLSVYDRMLNHSCGKNSGYWIDTAHAEEIARLKAADQISEDAFIFAYDQSCDFNSSQEVGKEVRTNDMNFDTFRTDMLHSCSRNSGYWIDMPHAEKIARLKAQGLLENEQLLRAYDQTCDLDSAKKVALEAKAGKMNGRVYDEILMHSCSINSGYWLDDGKTQEIAELSAQGRIDVRAFLDVYDRTCSYDNAKAIASCNIVGANLNQTLRGGQSSYDPSVSGSEASKIEQMLPNLGVMQNSSAAGAI
jgi:Zn-finger nucleic acid-binding protein